MKDLMVKHVNEGRKPGATVVNYKTPEELQELIDLNLEYSGINVEGLIPLIQNILHYSVNTWNPGFMDKLYAGTNPVGIISEMLITLLNANSHVYHVSPALTIIENTVSKELAKLLGMGGITCPGGSFSNQLAMITARNHMFPEIKTKGYFNFGKRLLVFTSSAGHYSIEKTAMSLGLGTDSVIKVSCDEKGRMRVDELELLIKKSIQQGDIPFFINATAGTTVLGAFDPLQEIGKIAKQYNIWFHVDGSWGGSLVFSKKHKYLLDGTNLANTLVINPHKMLGTPLQCSFLLAQNSQIFAQSNSLDAEYLFHKEKNDIGEGTVGCGRKPDAVKLFIGWKIFGIEGYQKRIEHAFIMSKHLLRRLKNHKRFRMVLEEPENLQVCFWYIPEEIEEFWLNEKYKKYNNLKEIIIKNNNEQLKNYENLNNNQENYFKNYKLFKYKLSKITKEIHLKIRRNGKYLFDYSPITLENIELPLFFRIVINSPTINEKLLDSLLDQIEIVGKSVMESLNDNDNRINQINEYTTDIN
ncbi:6951_t:CDS:2 [Diversispora eburnea]|uniref:6951_t:CDS:1 n=1 Tax=Diversispora eburnea TaxID=1213867 RepID=A0A9N9AUE1_9GLOM|nr:6951_t:CDS:2 [Diversispora eburnea]